MQEVRERMAVVETQLTKHVQECSELQKLVLAKIEKLEERKHEWVKLAIPIMIALVLQTSAGIWWAASISTEVGHLKQASQDTQQSVQHIEVNRLPLSEEQDYRRNVEERLRYLERTKTNGPPK